MTVNANWPLVYLYTTTCRIVHDYADSLCFVSFRNLETSQEGASRNQFGTSVLGIALYLHTFCDKLILIENKRTTM